MSAFGFLCQVDSTHPACSIVLHLLNKENECKLKMKTAVAWDGVSCWPSASEGETVSKHCLASTALISRNCTAAGWSKPTYEQDEDMGREKNYFDSLRLIYSVGYGVSLAALLVAILVFCCFRKLFCTRNYIHLNLFVSFILRSLAALIKDAVLFADKSMDHCTASTFQCKAAVTFFHFCVLTNVSWLLVEGLYLQTLLLLTFTQTRRLLWTKLTIQNICIKRLFSFLDSCTNSLAPLFVFYPQINLLIFLNISRIIAQKMKATNRNQSETRVTLVCSTLLLIPHFGLHYVLLALIQA
uniref:Growth hormone releasing hormone receptor 2 n=1 Tax=Acanthochromis polyacanthus TaxID=80966 RepID=A0A3Q1ED63_9TELE